MPDTSENEKQNKLREYIDMKVESVVMKLNVPRTSVHFIENYHENCIILNNLCITLIDFHHFLFRNRRQCFNKLLRLKIA